MASDIINQQVWIVEAYQDMYFLDKLSKKLIMRLAAINLGGTHADTHHRRT